MKHSLRESCKEELKNLSQDKTTSLDRVIQDRMLCFLSSFSYVRVALYVSLEGEVDLLPIVSKNQNKTFLLPKVSSEILTFLPWKFGEELVVDACNTFVPKENKGIIEPEIVVLPGLSFNHDGYRLGRGKGYYDRTLSTLCRKNKIVVGVCYDFQVIDKGFHESHDQKVDYIITEKRKIKIK